MSCNLRVAFIRSSIERNRTKLQAFTVLVTEQRNKNDEKLEDEKKFCTCDVNREMCLNVLKHFS